MTEKSNLLTVFVTLYNVADYLPRFFQCMESQTYTDYTLLIIDDGSEDNTLDICRSYAQKDPRIELVHLSHVGISAARNFAISMIRTPYTAFVDGDDVYEADYLRHLIDAREKYNADLVISRVAYRNESYVKGEETKARGELYIPREQFVEMLPVLLDDRRLNYLYAKLFKSEILKRTCVEDDVIQGSDTMFCCQYVTMANNIVLTDDLDTNYIKYSSRSVTSNHAKDEYPRLCRIQNTITEIFRNSGFLTESMQQVIDKRVLQSALWVLSSIAKKDISVNEALNQVYDIFHSADYTEAYCRQKENQNSFGFSVVDPENVKAPYLKISPRIVVSLTSYPARIQNVARVLETIYSQTKKADKVILWLAEDQFPMRKIPECLTEFVDQGKLVIRWCDDLKPHKKYFFAFRDFPNDLIITIDDDLLYSSTMVEDLYRSFLVHPNAISAMRAHLMIVEDGQFFPYMEWLHEYNLHIGEESMMLFATTGAGTLFPIYLFNLELLDSEAIRKTCLYADDIWLKLMQIEADVPVVIAKRFSGVKHLPGANETGLFTVYNREHNDEQLNAAVKWYDHLYGKDYILKKLEGYNDKLDKVESVIEFYKTMIRMKNREIKQKNEEISRNNEEIRRKDTELKQKNEEISRNNEEIRNRNETIKQQKGEIVGLRNELLQVCNSTSLKIGRIVTWPCRIIKGLFHN